MGLISSGITDLGLKRQSNQDSIFLDEKRHLFIVADGMGGHKGGDIASNIAINTIPEHIFSCSKDSPQQNLSEAIQRANTAILKKSKEDGKLQGMGTTVVSMLFHEQNLYIGNVGDSRAYLINKKKLYQMSKDHSLVQEKINIGVYDRDDAASDPQKNILVRTVGFEEQTEIDIFSYKVSRGDIFILCSDGLHGKVSDADIVHIVNTHIPRPMMATREILDLTARHLVQQANDNGGNDNISVILVVAQ